MTSWLRHGLAMMLRVTYDEDLANRIRELIGGDPDVTEMRMFGGLAFLVGGNMSVAASGQGGLMVRVDPAQADVLVTKPHAGLHPLTSSEAVGPAALVYLTGALALPPS